MEENMYKVNLFHPSSYSTSFKGTEIPDKATKPGSNEVINRPDLIRLLKEGKIVVYEVNGKQIAFTKPTENDVRNHKDELAIIGSDEEKIVFAEEIIKEGFFIPKFAYGKNNIRCAFDEM